MAANRGIKLFTPAAAGGSFGMDMIKLYDCGRWIISQLHVDGPQCPECSTPLTKDSHREKFFSFEQVRCPACGKKFTAATGTQLNESKLEVREVYLLAVLLSLDVAPARIAAILRVHVDTVRNWQGKFKAFEELSGA